jgi:hypothetical protein
VQRFSIEELPVKTLSYNKSSRKMKYYYLSKTKRKERHQTIKEAKKDIAMLFELCIELIKVIYKNILDGNEDIIE